MVIALSAADHAYVGVRAYCFLKPAVLLKAKQAQKKKSFCEIFFVRSGNLENNHSAESLRADVPAAPRRFRNVWTLAGSTIATFALLLALRVRRRQRQQISGLSNTPAGGRTGRSEALGGGVASAVKSPWDRVPEHGRVHRLGHRDAFLFFISLPFRCKLKSALIQSAFPPDRRWYLVVKTASVQLKDVFTNHTDTFCYRTNLCPCAPTATLAFFLLFFLRRRSHCFLTLRFTDKRVFTDSKRDVKFTSYDVFFQSVVDS